MPVCASTISTRRRCARQRARRCSPGATITALPPASSWKQASASRDTTRWSRNRSAASARSSSSTATTRRGSARTTTFPTGRRARRDHSTCGPSGWASNISMASSVATPISGRRRSSRTRGRSSRRMTIPITISTSTWPTRQSLGCACRRPWRQTSRSSPITRPAPHMRRITRPRSGSKNSRASSTKAGTSSAR